ncbi:MAG: BspA family leucine-rich repeat surface protein [bacterium]|nr:BspA family leucine-rich repeat surface protein [bacterium]
MNRRDLNKIVFKNRYVLNRLSLVLLVLGILFVVSGSYAFYKESYISKTESKITTDDVSIEYLESNTNVINLENALPMSDKEGKMQDNTFDFVVKTKTSRTLDIGYSLVIEKLEPTLGYSFLSDDDINVYLTDYNDNELVFKNIGDINKDYVLYTKTNNHNSTNKEIKDKYKLRVWVDKNVLTNDWNENTKLEYKFKIGVKTNVSDSDTEQTYVVKYNSNGGTGTMESTTFKQGESKRLSKNTFTKEGYLFIGWSTSSKSKEVVYTDEEEVSNLTNVYNGVVNLYAVWVKSGASYQIRYNSNGGASDILELTDEENHWTLENEVYKSGNYGVEDSVSVIKSSKFTLTETTTISFDWAVSSEEYDYLYYSIYKDGSDTPLEDTGEDTGISGNSRISDESGLKYETVTKELEPGVYVLEFTFMKDESDDGGLDRGYVKNVFVPGAGMIPNSKHLMGTKSKLSKNSYKKIGYVFKGWSTVLNGDVKYSDEEEVIDLALEDTIFDLYAVWEKREYEVNVVVQNGTVDVSSKSVKYDEDGVFDITPDITDPIGIVTCTNNQYGEFLNNKVTVKNVKSNTTCTVKLSEDVTSLYADGTFIINEQSKDRASNIEKHGEVVKEYEPMSSSQTYNFTFDEEEEISDTLWNDESANIKRVEIGENLKPLSTAYWFNRMYYIESSDLSNLDTSMTENMSGMFLKTDLKGFSFSEFDTSNVSNMSRMFQSSFYGLSSSFDLSNFDMSKVINTSFMFSYATFNSPENVTIKGISDWDVSNLENASFMFWGTNGRMSIMSSFVVDLSKWNTKSLIDARSMFNLSGSYATTWSVGDLSSWDTSKVIDMGSMFSATGGNVTSWTVGDLSKWDTSNVTDISGMFQQAGTDASTWSVGDLSKWDTSNVTDMNRLFLSTGVNTTTWTVGDLSNWNTSNVTDMMYMFDSAGKNATSWSVGDLSEWNTSGVTNMNYMFSNTGENATSWSVGDLSNWDTSQVIDMECMFSNAGGNATTFNLNLSSWDTSNVTNMMSMFLYAGKNAATWSVGDLSSWNTSQVTDMSSMFSYSGSKATTWNIGDLSSWNTSGVTDMSSMFSYSGSKATAFNLDLSNWDTSSVTSMSNMFSNAGYSATNWSIGDLSSWDTSKVTDMGDMFVSSGYDATSWSVGNLSKWNTTQVTNMGGMFASSGYSATTWSIGDLSNWDTSNVTNMGSMFSSAGSNATSWSVGNISNWDTSSVTSMSNMFGGVGINAKTFNLDLSGWNTSNATDMSRMFEWTGKNATTFNLNLSNWNTSNVTDMNEMFNGAGLSSTSWLVKIPSMTGSLTNTTSKWYGSSESVYAEPASGKSFTLS